MLVCFEIRINSNFYLKVRPRKPPAQLKTSFSRCLAGCPVNKSLAVAPENEIRRICGMFTK